MKLPILFIFFNLFCQLSAQPNNLQNQSSAEVTFEKTAHSFGIISEERPVSYEFKFTNIGSETLIIQQAITSCGCDMCTWSKEPILPGGKGSITYYYHPGGKVGAFTKSICFMSNAKNGLIILTTCGYVEDTLTKSTNSNTYYGCNCEQKANLLQQKDTISKRVLEGNKSLKNQNTIFTDSIIQFKKAVFNDFINQKVQIFPNPSSGKLFIKNDGEEISKVEIFNANGQVILTSNFLTPTNNYEIDLSLQSEGFYFLEMKTSTGVLRRKIVVKK